jgi:hypothetical protein
MSGTNPNTFAKLIQFLLELVRGKFYGTIHIQFRAGVIGIVKKEETFEAGSLPINDTESVKIMETGGRVELPA